MKAGVASPNGVVIRDIPQAAIKKPTDILVKVKAIALNRADLGAAKGDTSHGASTGGPIGSEYSGDVIEVGSEVRDFKPGDRVIAFSSYGAFAEECLVQAARLVPMPDAMDFVTGAAFLLTYGTSHHALVNRAAPKPGETLLVLGAAGGVGIAAIEIGKILGLRVIACASSAANCFSSVERCVASADSAEHITYEVCVYS